MFFCLLKLHPFTDQDCNNNWYCSIKMSRKTLPQRREKKKGCHLSQISIEMIWFGAVKKALRVRQLMVTYAEFSELFMIRQRAKRVDHEKDLTQFLRTKLLTCSSLLKYVKLQKTTRWLLRKQEILYQNVTLAQLEKLADCEQLIFLRNILYWDICE